MLIASLRQKILDRAIRGLLVEQRPEEGTAEELYQQIQAEKKKLIAEGKIKKEKPLPPIAEDKLPFSIPGTWKWVRLGEIGILKTGYAFKKSEYTSSGIQVVRISDLEGDEISTADAAYVPENSSYSSFVISKDSILICMTGSIGKMAYVNDDKLRYLNQRVGMFLPADILEKHYVWLFLNSHNTIDAWTTAKKSTNGNINNGDITELVLPMPPVDEQKRIVQKVGALFSELDAIGKSKKRVNAIQTELTKRILDQAIQGKLVPQRLEEGTAEELYQQIQTEKKRLIAEGKIKKEKPLPPIEEKDIPFDIPETWKWVQLGDIVYNRGQKVPNGDFSYIDISSINNQKNCLNEEANIISCDKAPSRARKIVGQGDILYATVRPYLHNVCIIDRDFSAEPIASTGFAVMTCLAGVYNKYLFYYLLSPDFDLYANRTDNAKGVAYPAISDKRLYKAPIALPPYEEQKRIVAKIEGLLTLCKSVQ